jgi:membrane-associated protein
VDGAFHGIPGHWIAKLLEDRLDHLIALIPQLPTLEEIVRWGGYAGLFFIIFAETGLLVGFFLPGDSLLVTAGLFAARGELDIVLLNVLLIVAAISGDATGYYIGAKGGHALYDRPQSRFFRRDHLIKTKQFYDRYGGITIVLARFIPFARTFAPVVAGVAEMTYRRFAMFNIAGGAGWIISMTLIGYFLGRSIPGIEKHVEYIIAVVIFLSILPLIIKYIQHKRKKPIPPPLNGREPEKAQGI